MCLMLLDPSMRRTTLTEGHHVNDGCIQEASQATASRKQHGSMLSPPASALLEQVCSRACFFDVLVLIALSARKQQSSVSQSIGRVLQVVVR